MNLMNNVANVDYDDLDAIVMWQKSMVEFFEKFGFSKNQLLKLMGEVAAKQMVIFSKNHWSGIHHHDGRYGSLTKCREEFQNAFLNAAHVPTHWPSVCISFPVMSPGTILELNFSWN
jgi:hypothetical protein